MDNHTEPTRATYSLHPPAPTGGMSRPRLIILVAAAVLIGAAAAVALYIAARAMGDVGQLTAKNRQLQDQVAGLSGQVTNLKTREHTDFMTVGRVLAPVLPLTTSVCSQDLTGPSGPQQYWFNCTSQKPAG